MGFERTEFKRTATIQDMKKKKKNERNEKKKKEKNKRVV